MSLNLRREVLKAFKSIHKVRKHVFQGDNRALRLAQEKINEEYKKCKSVTNKEAIQELIAYSKAVENELISTVIQAREIQPGQYEVRLRDEIVKLDNVPYKECPK